MSRMTAEEYQELGRRYYKFKQYDPAIEAFTKGIDLAPSLSLYDNRAATYDKLKDYNAAVKDGREMIKLDKKDVKGYLRTASVLEKMEKSDVALGIYKYGMKNVPIDDQNFKLLQKLHDNITRKLSPPKSVDPFTILPVELMEMILEYLSFKQVVNSMRVSKGWRDYLAKLPRLWLHLDLSAARKPVSRAFVDKAVRRSQNRLTQLTVHRFEHGDVLKNIAKACKDLAEVNFISLPHHMSATLIDMVQYASNLRKLHMRPEITADTMGRILSCRPNLEQVAFDRVQPSRMDPYLRGPFPRLDAVNITFNLRPLGEPGSVHKLLTQTPAIQSLTLSYAQIIDLNEWVLLSTMPLTSLILKQVVFLFWPRPLPSTLRTLVIQKPLNDPRRSMVPLELSRLPQLEHLTLDELDVLAPLHMQNMLDYYFEHEDDVDSYFQQGGNGYRKPVENTTPLKSVCFRGRPQEKERGLFITGDSLLGSSPRILTPALETLDIEGLPCDDNEIDCLVKYETGLSYINLSQTDITGASLRTLADKVPTLKRIKADDCRNIHGRDAVEYAISKGIAVSFINHDWTANGGRKVKY